MENPIQHVWLMSTNFILLIDSAYLNKKEYKIIHDLSYIRDICNKVQLLFIFSFTDALRICTSGLQPAYRAFIICASNLIIEKSIIQSNISD
jgi:hypothetical protein